MPEIVERGCISRSDKSLVPYWQIIWASVDMQPDVRHVGHGGLSGSRMRQNSGTGKENRKMERKISGRPIKVDHLQMWSQIFRSDRAVTNLNFHLTSERDFRQFWLK